MICTLVSKVKTRHNDHMHSGTEIAGRCKEVADRRIAGKKIRVVIEELAPSTGSTVQPF